jgi:hypothetical protein
MNSFQLIGLPAQAFAPLFSLSDDELAAINARRVIADGKPGYPCRVSMTDAEIGDELLLLPYEHQPAASPYRASGPVFVRRGVAESQLPAGELPAYVTSRKISLRAYGANHEIVVAEVCEGNVLRDGIMRAFADPQVDYLHLHHAGRGCYFCRVDRIQ